MYFIFHPISSINHLIARLVTDQITFIISIVFFVFLSLNYRKRFWEDLDRSMFYWIDDAKPGFLKNYAEDLAIFGNAIFHIVFMVFVKEIPVSVQDPLLN